MCQRRNGVVRLLNLTEGLRIWVDNELLGPHESCEVKFGEKIIIHSHKYAFVIVSEPQVIQINHIVNDFSSSSPSSSSQQRGEICDWILFFGLSASTGSEQMSGLNALEVVLDNNKSGGGEFLSMKTLIHDTQDLSEIAELSFFCLRILAERANYSLAAFVTSCYYTARAVDGEVMLTLPYLLSMAIKRLPVPIASLVLSECLLEPAVSLKGGAFQLMNEHKCLAELLIRTHPDGFLVLIESIMALLVCSSTEETILPFSPRLMDIVAWRLRIALSIPKFLPSSQVSVAKFHCDESFSTSSFTNTTLRLIRANEQILNILFVVYNTMQSRSENPSGMKSVRQPHVEVLQQMSFATLKLMLDDLALTPRKISVAHLRKLVLQSKTSAESTRTLPLAGNQSPTRAIKAKSQKQVFSWGTSVSFPDFLRLILNISEHLIDDLKQEVGGIFGYMNKSSAGRKMGLRFSPLFSLPFVPVKRKSDVVQNLAPASLTKHRNNASSLTSPLNSLRKKLFE